MQQVASSTQADGLVNATRTDAEAQLQSKGIASVELGAAYQGGYTHIALLVADEDVHAARKALKRLEQGRAHLFSPSGAEGASFRLDQPDYRQVTLAVLPIALAEDLLAKSRAGPGLEPMERVRLAAYVRTYFGSTARLIGLKGSATEADRLDDPEAIAEIASLDMSNRTELDRQLKEWGWRPSDDMLERLSLADSWIREELLAHSSESSKAPPGLSVFFIRARAVEMKFLDPMREALEAAGFEILRSVPLEGALAEQIEKATRGGNWGAGPFPLSGGPPVHVFIAVDVFPRVPSLGTQRKHPLLDNQRTLDAKLAAREAVFRDIPKSKRFNPLHSTDTSGEALRVIGQICPEADREDVRTQFKARLKAVDDCAQGDTRLPGEDTIAAMVSADTPAGPRLRKIFRAQCAEQIPAIADMHDQLAPQMPEFPPILERGDRFLDMSAPGAAFLPVGLQGRPIPVKSVLRLRSLLEQAAKSGARPVGFDPRDGVLISSDTSEIFVPPFDRLDANGAARPLTAIVPGNAGPGLSYKTAWYPVLGVPRQVFLSGNTPTVTLFNRVVYPAERNLRRLWKFSRKTGAAGWRRVKRLTSFARRR